MKNISLCLIGADEVDGLNRLLDSVQQYVDEVVLVSTRGSKKLEKAAKDRGVKVYSEPYPKFHQSYGEFDFASARNSSFDKATSEFIMWADLDDVIKNGERLLKIKEELEESNVDWIWSEYIYHTDDNGNVRARHWRARIMRKGTGVWEKSVHENFSPTVSVRHYKEAELTWIHTAKLTDHDSSADRNLRILLAEYEANQEDTDPRTLVYLGNTLYGLGDLEQAAFFYQKFLKKSGWEEEKYFAYINMATCLAKVGMFEQAINSCLEATKLFPDWSTAYLKIAELYHSKEDWKKVISWLDIAFGKEKPGTLLMLDDTHYTINPLAWLLSAQLSLCMFDLALETATKMLKVNPKDPKCQAGYDLAKDAYEHDKFVHDFANVANKIRGYDKLSASKLFDLLPVELDSDIRIQQLRLMTVAPKVWDDKSIVIFCGSSLEEWAYPSIFSGIGGSEEAVIYLSKELVKLGYDVTVYNNCGTMRGTYDGVKYLPYYSLNLRDRFNVFISWRNPGVFEQNISAKKKYLWLHDIAYDNQFNERIFKAVDKVFFLSKWHRNNLPQLPEDKVFITNNGISLDQFNKLDKTKKPNSLFWGSSYDRGLLPFIKNILPIIEKEIPSVTLDVAYGWQNIDKQLFIPSLKELKEELTPILESKENITHHDRLSHKKLSELMASCQVYAYASEFGETNNITSQKSQAAGCYVITTSEAGATPERVKFGEVIDTNKIYTDKESQERYAKAVINYLKNPKTLDVDLSEFDWSETAKNWSNNVLA